MEEYCANKIDLYYIKLLSKKLTDLYEEYKTRLLTNVELPLQFTLGGDIPHTSLFSGQPNYLCGINCDGCIVICLDTIVHSGYYLTDLYCPTSREEYDQCMIWVAESTLLHEMAHAGQQMFLLDTDIFSDYIFRIKETDADYVMSKIMIEELGCPERLMNLILSDGYQQAFLMSFTNNYRTDYYWYYYEFLKVFYVISHGTPDNNDIYTSLQILLYESNKLTIINNVNGMNIIIPVKIDGKIIPPGIDMCNLYGLLFYDIRNLDSKNKEYNVYVRIEQDPDDDYGAIFIIDGTRLIPGFTKDIGRYYNCT